MSQLSSVFLEASYCDLSNPCPVLYECIQSMCTHKSPFPPTVREVFGSLLLVLLLGMCNVGGMGGSFIASPILMMIFNFDTIPAIRITYCMSLSGAIGVFITNCRNRAPNSRKPLIDYDTALLCIPVMVAGASIGTIANSFLPPIACLSVLVLLCLIALVKCWKKAITQYRQENYQRSIQKVLFLLGIIANTLRRITPTGEDTKIEVKIKEVPLIENESKPRGPPLFPFRRYLQFLLLLLIVIVFLILRGSKSFRSVIQVKYCGGFYWMIYAFTIVSCFIFSFFAQCLVRKKAKGDSATTVSSESSSAAEKLFDVKKCAFRLSVVAFVSGVVAGFAGVGGGTILNPLFLDMGMSGPVAAATSSFLVLFTSFISVFQTALSGGLSLVSALYFGALSFLGALVIATVLKCIVKKCKRNSLILFVLCFVTCMGAVAVSTYIIYRMITNKSAMVGLGKLCQ